MALHGELGPSENVQQVSDGEGETRAEGHGGRVFTRPWSHGNQGLGTAPREAGSEWTGLPKLCVLIPRPLPSLSWVYTPSLLLKKMWTTGHGCDPNGFRKD